MRPKTKCSKCNREFSNSNFKRHFEQCDGIIKVKNTINENWLNKDSGKYKCPICSKEYTKKGISSHIWRTHGEGKDFKPVSNNHEPWNKGLTKETDERVKKYSETYKKNLMLGKVKRYKNLDKTDFKIYQTASKFKFSLNDFPEKYDFSLVEKYGWYKAKNRGDNPNGVSRDHIISCRYGFDNNIPTWIISHPANCELMPHKLNQSKRTKINLTLDELIIKIKEW